MTRRARPTTSLLPSLLVLCLALAGLAQGGALMLHMLEPEGTALLQRVDIVPMWALWLGVALSVATGHVAMWVRVAMVLCSVAGLAFRGVLVWFAWPVGDEVAGNHRVALMMELSAALIVPVVLTVWAAWDVARARRERTELEDRDDANPPTLPSPRRSASLTSSNGSAVATTSPDVPLSPHPERAEHPESALTPVGLERASFGKASTPRDGWRQVSSPWPRAVEDDPDGTLLRPPRRRVDCQRH